MRIIARKRNRTAADLYGQHRPYRAGASARFNVAIRTVHIDKARHEAEYGVGGGVAWDSTPRGEYDECLLKARILSTMRPEFSLLETLLWTPGDGYFCLQGTSAAAAGIGRIFWLSALR